MNYKISKSEMSKLAKIAKRIVIQSHQHRDNIIEFYRILALAAREEFTEENKYGLDSFLIECHRESLGLPAEEPVGEPRDEPLPEPDTGKSLSRYEILSGSGNS